MKLLEILLGQLPEALYFALFMIYTKRLDRKRELFIMLMLVEYILLLNALPFSVWSHTLYFLISYIILKLLYKEKAQITDIFTLGIASIIIMIVSVICYVSVFFTLQNIILSTVLAKTILFVSLFALKYKLPNIQKIYKKLWNRNDKLPKFMKSTTFRCINIILFNFMFYLINSFVLFAVFWYGGE